MFIFSITVLAILFIILIASGIISYFEKEYRAGNMFVIFSFIALSISFAYLLIDHDVLSNTINLLTIIIAGFALILLIPLDTKRIDINKPAGKIDERITMFSRAGLSKGSSNYNDFYNIYPYYLGQDKKWRKNPGLGNPNSKYYKKLAFTASEASFKIIKNNRKYRNPEVSNDKAEMDPGYISGFLKNWSKQLGAYETGICELKNYHIYSIRGRGEDYGKKIDNDHKYCIVFTIPMSKKMVDTAPAAPTMMESAKQYTTSGVIALQISEFIASLGYSAKAHIDGAYDFVLPLVAQDAGLGTIGRMGLLINNKLGPRCRIAAVSTNMPMAIDKVDDPKKSIIHFCQICKKCAENCPSNAIHKDNRSKIDGIYRWQINQEACYTYWTIAGTDCARCMKVCPFSHPDNVLHKLIRKGINNNYLFRILALYMDNLFYGKNPKSATCKKFNK